MLKPVCSTACVPQLESPHAATKEPVVPAMKDLHEAMKIPHAATKTLHSQINCWKEIKEESQPESPAGARGIIQILYRPPQRVRMSLSVHDHPQVSPGSESLAGSQPLVRPQMSGLRSEWELRIRIVCDQVFWSLLFLLNSWFLDSFQLPFVGELLFSLPLIHTDGRWWKSTDAAGGPFLVTWGQIL